MPDAHYELVADRENKVFKVVADGISHALRLHRKGYRTDPELQSELQWMAVLKQNGLSVPSPIPSKTGEALHTVDSIQVDVLTWLSGAPVGKSNEPLNVPDRIRLFHDIGTSMAMLHTVSDAWDKPVGFVRCVWDRNGLIGEQPVWGRFWDNPGLTSGDRKLFLNVRNSASAKLLEIEGELDFGLIHADLVRENIMIDDGTLHLIDFDDGGFGFRLFEIATTLLKAQNEPDYPALKSALIDGYITQRPLNIEHLDLFILLRALTYVGWNITRMENETSKERNHRFINTARNLALDYQAR